MDKKTFITKEDLQFYHDETAKKLKTSLKKVEDNIGDINISEKISELEQSIKYSAVQGQQYDENTNTTTFIKGTSAGNVKLNELYIKRDGLYKPLSEIIGGIYEYNENGTVFDGNVSVKKSINCWALYPSDDLYYSVKDKNGNVIAGKYEKLKTLLAEKNDFLYFCNDQGEIVSNSIYIILKEDGSVDIDSCFIDQTYTELSDDGFYKTIKNITNNFELTRVGPAYTKRVEKCVNVNVYIYDHLINSNEPLSSEDNLNHLIHSETCLMLFDYHFTKAGKGGSTTFTGIIYGDFVFQIKYKASSSTVLGDSSEFNVSLLKNKTPINEVTDESDRPVTSYAVYDALENLSNNIAGTYVSKTAHAESEQAIVNIKKLLYNLTTRVDELDLNNIAFSDAKSLTTLRRVNYFGNLSYDDRTIVSERYGLQNKNYIIIFEDNTGNSFVKNFKIGQRLGFKGASFENYIAATILDIYYFKSKNSSSKYYYCVCVSSDVAKYFMATSSSLTLYLLPENLPTAPTISIIDVTQTSATLSWKDSDSSTGSHIVVKYGSQVIKDISTTSYVSTIQTSTLTGLSCDTIYTVEITAKLDSWESTKNTKTFTTDPLVKPEPVYIYMPNATTNSLTRIRQEEEQEFFTDNKTELFANGIIYTDNKFNSREKLRDLYLKYGLDRSLNSDESEDNEPLSNKIITSDDKFTLLIQPAYNGEDVETFNYKIRLNIYEYLGLKRECFTGYLSNALEPIDPTKFDGEILYDNSVITPRTVEVLGVVYDSHNFIESDNVHIQILQVRWKYPNDFIEYEKTLGIYREDDETPVVYENYNLFQNKPINDIFYAVIIKGFKNTLFHFEINKPDEMYYDSTFVYKFNVCSINRFIKEFPITINKNTFENDPNNVLTAYNSKNVQNILVQYSDYNTKTFYKILPATPIFYNIPDTYGRKQYIIECANIEECAIKGKYFDVFNEGKPMYQGDSGQYLTIYFTYGLNDLYAYFDNSYQWIESEDDYISAVDAFNQTLNDMHIDSQIQNDGGGSYDPNMEQLFPKITIKLNLSSTGIDDEINFITYNDYANYYEKGYLIDSHVWKQLANNGAQDAIRITNDESMKIDDPYRRVVRPGIFSLTFDIACFDTMGVDTIDRIDILVDFNMNDRSTPFVGEVIRPQRIILNGIQSLIQGLK